MKRAIALIIGIAVSVFLFARSMAGTSMEGLRVAFQSANYLTLPLMLMLLFGFYWLKAMRWKWLLAPVCPLTTRQLFKPLLIGFAFNNLLPAHLGEFVRVFVVRTRHGVPASTVLSTVVLERIFDVVAILALFSLGLLFTDDMPQEYRDNALIFAGFCVVGVLCVAAYLIWTDWFLKLSETMMGWVLPKAISAKILEMLQAGAHGLHALKSGKAIFLIAVSSLAQWTLNGLIAYTALKAFHVPVTISAGMIITGVTAMGVTIPSTPGYFALGGCPSEGRAFGVYEPARIPARLVPQEVVLLGGTATRIESLIVKDDSTEIEITPAPEPRASVPGGRTRSAPLGAVFGARSGDKGGHANLGVFAREDAAWAWLDACLTTERLASLLPEVASFEIERHRFPALRSLNFVIHGLLEEGVAAATRQDGQAKSLGEWLRARHVEIPEALLS